MKDILIKTGKRGRPKYDLTSYIQKMESFRVLTPELEKRCLNFLYRLIEIYGTYKVKWWLIKDEKIEKLGVSKSTSLHWEQTPLFRLSPEDMKYLASIVEERYEIAKKNYSSLNPKDTEWASQTLIFNRNALQLEIKDTLGYNKFLPQVTWNESKKECDISYDFTTEAYNLYQTILSIIPNIMPCSLINGETEANKKRKGVELAEKFNLNIPELKDLDENSYHYDTSVFYFHTGWTKDQWDYCEKHLRELKEFKKLKYSQLRERMMCEENVELLRGILDYPKKVNEYLALVTVHLFLYYVSIHKQWDSEFILKSFHEIYKVFPWYEEHSTLLYSSLYSYLLGFDLAPSARSMFQKASYLEDKRKAYMNSFFEQTTYSWNKGCIDNSDLMVFSPLLALKQLIRRFDSSPFKDWKKLTVFGFSYPASKSRQFFEKDPSLVFTPPVPKEVFDFTKKMMIVQVSNITPEIARFVWLFEKTDSKVREEGIYGDDNNNEFKNNAEKVKSYLKEFTADPVQFLRDVKKEQIDFDKNIPFDENFRYEDNFYGLSMEDVNHCKTFIESKVLDVDRKYFFTEDERQKLYEKVYQERHEIYEERRKEYDLSVEFHYSYDIFQKECEEYLFLKNEEGLGISLILTLPSFLGYWSMMTLPEYLNPKYSRNWFSNLMKSWEIDRIMRAGGDINNLKWDITGWLKGTVHQIKRQKTMVEALYQGAIRKLKGAVYVS